MTTLAQAHTKMLPAGEPLLEVKSVYVEVIAGGTTAVRMRDMLIASLENLHLFRVTEDPARADAILRGSADDQVYTDSHQTSESLNANIRGTNFPKSKSDSRYTGTGISHNESWHDTERRHEASASVHLVSKNGDVIWSTTQESLGAKFQGSSADVADKITRKLVADLNQARARAATTAKVAGQ